MKDHVENQVENHVRSVQNKLLISRYAFKKLRSKFQISGLQEIIDLNLEAVLDNLFDKETYVKWQLTAENVAEINAVIMTNLQNLVVKSMEGREKDSLKAIEEMLASKIRPEKEERFAETLERTF
jgi:hypothetical protein